MAYKTESGLPDAIARREILAGDRKNVDLAELGDAYLNAGWLSDALDCFERLGDPSRLEALKKVAIERDCFLLTRIDALVGLSAEEWKTAASIARDAGRFFLAHHALERAGENEEAAALADQLESFRLEIKDPEAGRWGRPAVLNATDTSE